MSEASSIITTRNNKQKRVDETETVQINRPIKISLSFFRIRWSEAGGGRQSDGKKVTSGDEERHVKEREETKNIAPEDAREEGRRQILMLTGYQAWERRRGEERKKEMETMAPHQNMAMIAHVFSGRIDSSS